jgi:protein transport protein SEC23
LRGFIMDYEALKEQWSEVEDRDGVRLSWNVLPSSRMVHDTQFTE